MNKLLPLLLVCATPALAEGGAATISTGASWSSLRGGLAFITLEADNFFGTGIDLTLRYDRGEDGQASSARLQRDFDLGTTRMGADSHISVALDGMLSDWGSQSYSARNYGLDISFGASPLANFTYDLRLFHKSNELFDFGAGISPLVATEEGKSTATGLGLNLAWSTLDDPALPHSGLRFGADLAWASPAGDREWMAVSLSGGAALPVASNFTLALKAEGGQIRGLNGQNVSIIDRAFLGNPLPRGFAAAGIGPRDFIDGTIDAALGGNQFVVGSIELRYQTPRPELTVGGFFDAGALWDLDVTAGGASGTIDDAYHLRTAVGVAVYWQTKLGLVQISVAKPVQMESYDADEMFALGLSTKF